MLFIRVEGSKSYSRLLEEPEIKGYKNQNNADIRYQPLPESILKEQYIHADDNRYHYQNKKYDIEIFCHVNSPA